MVILTGKISKGTLMDQIYISKERPLGFGLGVPVIIKLAAEEEEIRPIYYNVSDLEPIKISIIEKIFIELNFADNIIITGSFLEKGFLFNDIDVVLIYNKIDTKKLEARLNKIFGLEFHILALNYNTLLKGLETDPLFQAMLSRYVAKKKLIFRVKAKINFKLLDLHLLKSKPLMENFDYLPGKQKYDMARNLMAMFLFLNNKEISNDAIDYNIKKLLKEESINIKQNVIINKSLFLKKYKSLYNNLFKKILAGIKNDS